MNSSEKLRLLEQISETAFKAGKEILSVYETDFDVDFKLDESPLTLADQKAHQTIVDDLKTHSFPILSEEGKTIPYEERKEWEYFWMVDPLDGTKEFVKRNGEFTVNIALIHNQQSLLGVIYVPVTDELYIGGEGIGAFKIPKWGEKLSTEPLQHWLNDEHQLPKKSKRPFTIVGSRSHMSPETEAFIEEKRKEKGEVELISKGSSLKLCMVAEGRADCYPRFAPTMEWDTAAGQAIVEAMGGKVMEWETKEIMKYNRKNLLNDWFLVSAIKDN